jgi:hypothetical protein
MRCARLVPALALTGLAATAMPAQAHDVVFIGTLSTQGEAVLNPPSQGTGSVVLVFNDDEFTMDVSVTFSGLSGTTTASHIHCCTASPGSGTAGVATPVPTFPEFPLGVTAGSYHRFFDLTQTASWNPAFLAAHNNSISDAFATLSTGIFGGTAYLNIHTSLAGGGEIRAFLTPVPEPAAYGLMGLGLPALGAFSAFIAQRRRGAGSSLH